MKEILFKTSHTKIVKASNGHEMVERPMAVAILALVDKNKVVMVQQERGDFGSILEVPAGKVESGEDPKDAIRRELLEETGYEADVIETLTPYYPSVGYSTEEIHCFYTENPKNTGIQRLDDNERINIKVMTIEDIYALIKDGVIKDSKTLMCLFGLIIKGVL